MKYIRLRDVVPDLEYHELKKIQKDLDSGAIHLKNLIDQEISKKEKEHRKNCSVCQTDIDGYSTQNYTLIFGPSDFRKQATFCALDCLEYFIKDLKERKRKANR